MFSGMTLAAEHFNWLWSFCTLKSIIGPCLGAVRPPPVQAPSNWKKKRRFSCFPSQASAVLLRNSFPSLALSQPSFSLWLSVWTALDAARAGNSLYLLCGCWLSLPFVKLSSLAQTQNVCYTSMVTAVGLEWQIPARDTHTSYQSLRGQGRLGPAEHSWADGRSRIPQWCSMCRDQVCRDEVQGWWETALSPTADVVSWCFPWEQSSCMAHLWASGCWRSCTPWGHTGHSHQWLLAAHTLPGTVLGDQLSHHWVLLQGSAVTVPGWVGIGVGYRRNEAFVINSAV